MFIIVSDEYLTLIIHVLELYTKYVSLKYISKIVNVMQEMMNSIISVL